MAIGILAQFLFPYEILSETFEVDHQSNYLVNRIVSFAIVNGLLLWIGTIGYFIGQERGEKVHEKSL